MQQPTPEMMQQEMNAIKIRCFDAESIRDRALQEAQGYNTFLTNIADKLGVIQEVDGKRVFDSDAVNARIDILIDKENELTKSDDSAATLKSKLEDITERLGCTAGIDVGARIDSLIKKARWYDEELSAPDPVEQQEVAPTARRNKPSKNL